MKNRFFDSANPKIYLPNTNHENKYEFPPPVDSMLLFGKCILVNLNSDLKVSEWNSVYEHLYGGFEDIGEDDSTEEDDELDENSVLTKAGYLKDDFVVDDDEDDDDDEEESEEEECDDVSDEEVTSKTKSKGKKGVDKKGRKSIVIGKSKCLHNKASSIVQPSYLDCTSELEEEKYV